MPSLARQPTPLVAKWRREEAEVSAWFWDRGYKLWDRDGYKVHLEIADPERHARLLAAIHALDLACAHERPEEIAAAGESLVHEWKAVIAFMRQFPLSEAAQ